MLIKFLLLSTFIENQINYHIIHSKNYDIRNGHKIFLTSLNDNTNKIGIVDFRFILKKSNAMKILGKKFISLEKEMNDKIKNKQLYLKNKELEIKKEKSNLTKLEYKKKIDTFKKEVLTIQKKFKEDRVILNNSFQSIQNDLKDLLAKVIKNVSTNRKIQVVLLKENVFLYNNDSIDITNEVLRIFNDKTRSLKIIKSSDN